MKYKLYSQKVETDFRMPQYYDNIKVNRAVTFTDTLLKNNRENIPSSLETCRKVLSAFRHFEQLLNKNYQMTICQFK